MRQVVQYPPAGLVSSAWANLDRFLAFQRCTGAIDFKTYSDSVVHTISDLEKTEIPFRSWSVSEFRSADSESVRTDKIRSSSCFDAFAAIKPVGNLPCVFYVSNPLPTDLN